MKSLRKYGKPPFNIVVVHGGPGGPGEIVPVARRLSKKQGVLEPLQTKNSVAGQILELKTIIEKNAQTPVVLIGWSWGAWLSFMLTAKYPKLVKKLILIGSGSFEAKYTKQIMKTRMSRLSEKEKKKLSLLFDGLKGLKGKEKEVAFSKIGKLINKVDSFGPIFHKDEVIETQPEIFESVWEEASKLRKSGDLLAQGKKICCPVVAIHGDFDPHPAKGVEIPLKKEIKDFRFVLLNKCGHYPWYEKYTRDEFYKILTKEVF